jgi:hypothetical protein
LIAGGTYGGFAVGEFVCPEGGGLVGAPIGAAGGAIAADYALPQINDAIFNFLAADQGSGG